MTVPNLIVFGLAFVLAFLLLAYAAPKKFQVKISRKLSAPPDRIWPYLSVPERYPNWFPFLTDCRAVNGTQNGVGQKRLVKIDRNKNLGEREEEVTRWDENQVIELQHVWEKMDGKLVRWVEARTEYRLKAVDDGTEMTSRFWFSGQGLMGKIFSLLSFRKKHEMEHRLALDNLEKRLQEETYKS